MVGTLVCVKCSRTGLGPSARTIGRRMDQGDPGSIHGMVEQGAILAIIIANQEPCTFAKRCRLPDLLRHPGITGRSGDIDMDDLS
jgi:hypothetical protein